MASILITGASGGLGLELAKQLLDMPASSVSKVLAMSRSTSSTAFQSLIDAYGDRFQQVVGDVNDDKSVEDVFNTIESTLGSKGLDILINNAATFKRHPGGTIAMKTDDLAEVLNVNVVGVHRVTAAAMPLLRKGKLKRVINISSTVGSISWAYKFVSNPAQEYEISKTALNMMTVKYALDLGDEGFTFLLVSPGWMRTTLGGEGADLDVTTGAKATAKIIMEATPKQNGKFLNIHVPGMEDSYGEYNGKEVTW